MNQNLGHEIVFVVNGLDFVDGGMCKCACARLSFENYGLPEMKLMKLSRSSFRRNKCAPPWVESHAGVTTNTTCVRHLSLPPR